jgi:hypothetical protein
MGYFSGVITGVLLVVLAAFIADSLARPEGTGTWPAKKSVNPSMSFARNCTS